MKKLVLILFLSLCATVGMAQKSIETLNAEIRRAEEDIRKNNALLSETRQSQATSQRELKLIQGRINSRRKIVTALSAQIQILNTDLSTSQSSVNELNKEQTELKEQYGDMIRESYKNYLLNNYLAFLFASKDFDDATRRINYMRRYNAMRENKVVRIDSMSGAISMRIVEINTKLEELDKTKAAQTVELAALGDDEKQYQTTLKTLKTQESKISKEIADRRAKLQKAQQEIARIVAAENKKSGKQTLTTEQLRIANELSGRFDQNRGKLPWPVRGGVIIDHYGLHSHSTQKGVMVDNKGVNIAGARGAEVRCVFEGVVTNVFFYQGLNNNVMVRHGGYLTVYSNLASVAVKVGDKVVLNHALGRLTSNGTSDDYFMHFEVWKESENMNPAHWLMP